jgi:hypothetical protein
MLRSRSILSVIALSVLISAVPSAAMNPNGAPAISAPAIDSTLLTRFQKLPSLRTAAFAFMLASAYSLYSRPSVEEKDWTSRFDLGKVTDLGSLFSSDYWKNLWYLYEDEWVGQCYKSKAIKLGTDDEHRLQVHKGDCYPHGVCGNIDARVKLFSKGMEGLSNVLLTYFLLAQYGVYGPIQLKLNTAAKDMKAANDTVPTVVATP